MCRRASRPEEKTMSTKPTDLAPGGPGRGGLSPATAQPATGTGDCYMSGFNNEFATEALPGALPVGRNSPQKAPYGLYAEQLSGTAFTAPRGSNRRSWLYRIRPAAVHKPFVALENNGLAGQFRDLPPTPPNQLRWDPLPMPTQPAHLIGGR